MKRYKKVYILLAVLAVVCAMTVIVTHTEEKKERIKNTDEIILAVPAEQVTGLSWQYGDTSLSFLKDENWKWEEDEAFPVDENKINDLLSVFEQFGACFVIEEVEDFSQYGLNKPKCTIELTTEGTTYEIKLGDFSTLDSQRYVSIGDGNVYLVSSDPYDTYQVTISDLIHHDTIPEWDGVTAISFSGTENDSVYYEENSANTYCASDVYFTQQGGNPVPLDTDRVESYLDTISSLKLNSYVTYNASADELQEMGLATPELSVALNYYAGDEEDREIGALTLNLGRNPEQLAEKDAAEAEGENWSGTLNCYARVGDSPVVYEISEDTYESLLAASYDDLRHRDIFTADFDAVTQIQVTLEGKTYVITAEPSEEDGEDTAYIWNDEKIDITSFRTCLKLLTVDNFTEETPTQKEEISFVFTLDNENYPTVSLKLYRRDGTFCLAVLDGKPLCLVSRTLVMNLTEAVYSIVLG